jgi:hypothetical protein
MMFRSSSLGPEAYSELIDSAVFALNPQREAIPAHHHEGIMNVLRNTYLPEIIVSDSKVPLIDVSLGSFTGQTALMPLKPNGKVTINIAGLDLDPDSTKKLEIPHAWGGTTSTSLKGSVASDERGRVLGKVIDHLNMVIFPRVAKNPRIGTRIAVHEVTHAYLNAAYPEHHILARVQGFTEFLKFVQEVECHGVDSVIDGTTYGERAARKWRDCLRESKRPATLDLTPYPFARKVLGE